MYPMSELTSVPTSSLSSTSVTTSVQETTTNGIIYLFISGHSIHCEAKIRSDTAQECLRKISDSSEQVCVE